MVKVVCAAAPESMCDVGTCQDEVKAVLVSETERRVVRCCAAHAFALVRLAPELFRMGRARGRDRDPSA